MKKGDKEMAKRFTDTEKWKDPWYRKLEPEMKVVWQFLTDNCDHAGFWKKDYELASFLCGFDFNEERIFLGINLGKERIKDHGEHIQVVDFVKFQYGELREDCRPHKSVIDKLTSYGEKIERFQRPTIEQVEEYFSSLGRPEEANKFFDHFSSNGWKVGGKAPMKDWKAACRTWAGRTEKKTISIMDRARQIDRELRK
jgi:hypothetical protein